MVDTNQPEQLGQLANTRLGKLAHPRYRTSSGDEHQPWHLERMLYGENYASPLALNMHRHEEAVVVRTAVPGAEQDDVSVDVQDNVLTLRVEHRDEMEDEYLNTYVSELPYGKYERSVHLPTAVDVDEAVAELHNGVLTVTLPTVGDEDESLLHEIAVTVKEAITPDS